MFNYRTGRGYDAALLVADETVARSTGAEARPAVARRVRAKLRCFVNDAYSQLSAPRVAVDRDQVSRPTASTSGGDPSGAGLVLPMPGEGRTIYLELGERPATFRCSGCIDEATPAARQGAIP